MLHKEHPSASPHDEDGEGGGDGDGTLFNNIIRQQAYALPVPPGSILHEGIT